MPVLYDNSPMMYDNRIASIAGAQPAQPGQAPRRAPQGRSEGAKGLR